MNQKEMDHDRGGAPKVEEKQKKQKNNPDTYGEEQEKERNKVGNAKPNSQG